MWQFHRSFLSASQRELCRQDLSEGKQSGREGLIISPRLSFAYQLSLSIDQGQGPFLLGTQIGSVHDLLPNAADLRRKRPFDGALLLQAIHDILNWILCGAAKLSTESIDPPDGQRPVAARLSDNHTS